MLARQTARVEWTLNTVGLDVVCATFTIRDTIKKMTKISYHLFQRAERLWSVLCIWYVWSSLSRQLKSNLYNVWVFLCCLASRLLPLPRVHCRLLIFKRHWPEKAVLCFWILESCVEQMRFFLISRCDTSLFDVLFSNFSLATLGL